MEIKILTDEKNELKLELDNLTIAEILRVYLHQDDSVSFAAWNREHPSKPAVLLVKTKDKTAKKAVKDAISRIEKETDKLVKEFKAVVK